MISTSSQKSVSILSMLSPSLSSLSSRAGTLTDVMPRVKLCPYARTRDKNDSPSQIKELPPTYPSIPRRTKKLAAVHAEKAMDAVVTALDPSPFRDSLVHLACRVVDRSR